ncbi:MAG: transcriptional repressor LexA [Peptostreptococcus sp.]|uniref:transcriptional repressor LexA n=1 Tax=Peptostreptococcus sp. TaxID=1262 RepID=UPI002FCB334D
MYEDLKAKEILVLEYIKEHSGAKGYPPSVREICKKLDIKSTSTVFNILNRLERFDYIRKDATKPRAIEILSKGITSENTVGYNSETINIPIVGQIAAGEPIFAEENIEEYMTLPSSHVKGQECFMLRVKGDSMIDVGIMNRDYIIVDSSQINPTDGKIVVALVNEDTSTVKTFLKKGDKIVLKPENALYEPMVFEADEVSIMGTVTGVFRVI